MTEIHILLIDDEPGLRLAVPRVLDDHHCHVADVDEKICFKVSTAEDGETGLERIADLKPDILLLDHKLPGISGLEVLSRLHEQGDGAPLTIMVTAYASLETAILATKEGAYDFLAKPFTPDELRLNACKAARHLMLQRQALALKEEKHKVRFQFISVLAHELKAPLGAVEGYLNIMRDQTLGTDLNAYESSIQRSLVRLDGMRKLIVDLLDLTRIESGEKQRKLERCDIAGIARGCMELVEVTARERDISLNIQTDGDLTLLADRGELEIILNNLLSNAVKYNRDGGRVNLRLEGDDTQVRVAVEDTGIGMSPKEAARLFGEFVRIKNAKTRNIMGSGLGLSIVKKLALLYDGDVSANSRPDEGSCFLVTLKKGDAA